MNLAAMLSIAIGSGVAIIISLWAAMGHKTRT